MPGPCRNHPAVEGPYVCAGCRQSFCGDCVVEMGGSTWCGACKNRAVAGSQQTMEYKLPGEALTYAIVGIFCCGIILGPIAIVKGKRALDEIGRNPSLPGHGKAMAAVVIGAIVLLLNIGGFVIRMVLIQQGVR